MHILIGLAMAAGLLYYWLLGHWFARVLVFLGLFFCAGFMGLFVGATNHDAGGSGGSGVVVFVISAGLAWVIAALPVWWWRQQFGEPFSVV